MPLLDKREIAEDDATLDWSKLDAEVELLYSVNHNHHFSQMFTHWMCQNLLQANCIPVDPAVCALFKDYLRESVENRQLDITCLQRAVSDVKGGQNAA